MKRFPLSADSGLWHRALAVLGLALSAYLVLPPLLSPGRGKVEPTQPQARLASIDSTPLATRPIEQIRVGDRVMARNPEVSEIERDIWGEPRWDDWVQVSLKMPLSVDREDAEPLILDIEIMRPESWVLGQLNYIAQSRGADTPDGGAGKLSQAPLKALVPFSPLRPLPRRIAYTAAMLKAADQELLGWTLNIDLPEMGAKGAAVLTDYDLHPNVKAGAGQVVTATFAHPPANQVLDVRFEGDFVPMGVTDNHLFWSEDRQRFVPMREMRIGEHALTVSGSVKRLIEKRNRPSPESVYNLEVFGEHVYFVGHQGILAHNAYTHFKEKIEDLTGGAAKSMPHQVDRAARLMRQAQTTGRMKDWAKFRGYMNKTFGVSGNDLRSVRSAYARAGHGNSATSTAAQEVYEVQVRFNHPTRPGLNVKVGITEASKGRDLRLAEQADNIIDLLKSKGITDVGVADLEALNIANIAVGRNARAHAIAREQAEAYARITSLSDLPGHVRPRPPGT